MRLGCRSRIFFAAGVLLLVVAVSIPALAFQYPVSSTDIRDASFLGRSKSDSSATFLAQYVRKLDAPSSGPFVSRISIDTPFTFVAAYCAAAANYDAPRAVQDFQGKATTVRVEVQSMLTSTYHPGSLAGQGSAAPDDPPFWQDFKIKLVQEKEVEAKSLRGHFIYPPVYDSGGPVWPIGAAVDLTYAPETVGSAPTTVGVTTPDGQTIESKFDFSLLR